MCVGSDILRIEAGKGLFMKPMVMALTTLGKSEEGYVLGGRR